MRTMNEKRILRLEAEKIRELENKRILDDILQSSDLTITLEHDSLPLISRGGLPPIFTPSMFIPDIISHKYKDGLTIIKWSDGTTTKVYKNPEESGADEYTGFMIALAKKAFGNDNTANNLADKWLVKIPKREAAEKAKKLKEQEERKKIEENQAKRKAKRDRKRKIALLARERKEAYEREKMQAEVEKLAYEKYDVPIDY